MKKDRHPNSQNSPWSCPRQRNEAVDRDCPGFQGLN
jgi:hypothetical protein